MLRQQAFPFGSICNFLGAPHSTSSCMTHLRYTFFVLEVGWSACGWSSPQPQRRGRHLPVLIAFNGLQKFASKLPGPSLHDNSSSASEDSEDISENLSFAFRLHVGLGFAPARLWFCTAKWSVTEPLGQKNNFLVELEEVLLLTNQYLLHQFLRGFYRNLLGYFFCVKFHGILFDVPHNQFRGNLQLSVTF